MSQALQDIERHRGKLFVTHSAQRYRCRACWKTFTAKPGSNRITPEKEQLIARALEERLSIEAVARLTRSAKRTVYNVLKKRQNPPPLPPLPAVSPAVHRASRG